MKKTLLFIFPMALSVDAFAGLPTDTARVIDIEEAVVVAAPKQNVKLRKSPLSVTMISSKDMENMGITEMNELSGVVPNLFIPNYGSRITSAVYVRGIGSRSGTPAVGLYVDNIPVIDKSTYDFNFLDVERIDLLRGPQATLYGRNTMGGLMRVYTRNPFKKQGTEVALGASTKDGGYKASFMTYQKLSDKFAFSFGGLYQGAAGFFRNDSTGKKVDKEQDVAVRMRAVYKPISRLTFDFTANYEYSDEGAYPYRYDGATDGKTEEYPTLVGGITANRQSSYRRGVLNAGVSAEYKADNFILSSVTGYQNLSDRMYMDQDFIYKDIYTLEQKQKANTITEELTIRSIGKGKWQWTTGAFGMYQMMRTSAPVSFYSDGIDWLNGTISNVFTQKIPPSISQMLNMSLNINNELLRINGDFRTPILSTAVFHESTLKDIFTDGLAITLGLRLSYENQRLSYASRSADGIDYTFAMNPAMPMIPSMSKTLQSAAALPEGKMKKDDTQLLPKIGLTYDVNEGTNIYLAFSKGYRSGGYNIQMFSEIIQNVMMNEMKAGVKSLMPQNVQGMMGEFMSPSDINLKQTVSYKPEYSWNYEFGVHHNLFDKRLQMDFSAFYMDTHDQQISRFAQSGMGRILVNAGRSHSMGFELALRSALLENNLNLMLSYGFTHAEFDRYDVGDNTDYTGNRVPMIPNHTLGLQTDYRLPFKNSLLHSLTFSANMRGMGRIYWTEANNAYQNFYATLGAGVTADFGKIKMGVRGENITSSRYDTFYFESMSRKYTQMGMPFQLLFDLRLSI